MNDVYAILHTKKVADRVKKKGSLNYISWADCWAMIKESFPDAAFEKHLFELDGRQQPYMIDSNGYAYVMVSVEIKGVKYTEILPVLDHRNKAVQNPGSDQVNKSLQRCLVKACAMHGLGISLYQGEDLPDDKSAAAELTAAIKGGKPPADDIDEFF